MLYNLLITIIKRLYFSGKHKMTIGLKLQYPVTCLWWRIKDGSFVICKENTSGIQILRLTSK